ncbi:TfoX/Sxy family protein [Nocardioides sp. R-C-SC26]|uniref:TfoX/Sxy family protein n=1 Tax=Nocardioides sp. R-C-SC26 TaxID=2870414 RepID=UPI001E2D5517|nr:TfoX/Sxy family protein [Nocardioides sp. R-C-SC26]
MAYDVDLADRVRDLLPPGTVEKPMFGGLGFMVGGNLAVCVSGQGGVLVRVTAEDSPGLIDGVAVVPLVMGGRESRTWLRVDTTALDGAQLTPWVARGLAVATSLPPK